MNIIKVKSEAMAKKKTDYIKDVFIPRMTEKEEELPNTAQELTDYCVIMYELVEEEKSKVGFRNNLN